MLGEGCSYCREVGGRKGAGQTGGKAWGLVGDPSRSAAFLNGLSGKNKIQFKAELKNITEAV